MGGSGSGKKFKDQHKAWAAIHNVILLDGFPLLIPACQSLIEKVLRNCYEDPDTGCWLFEGKQSRGGYGRIRVPFDGGRNWGTHRLVCYLYRGLDITNPERVARHTHTGNRHCCRPSHVQPGTVSENQNDRYEQGTMYVQLGERQHMASMSDSTALLIAEIAKTLPYRKVAKKFGVSHGTVARIARGQSWRWLTGINPILVPTRARRPLTQNEIQLCHTIYQKTGSYRETARQLGLPEYTVRRAMIKLTAHASHATPQGINPIPELAGILVPPKEKGINSHTLQEEGLDAKKVSTQSFAKRLDQPIHNPPAGIGMQPVLLS